MFEACGTFNYVINAYCDGTIIYNDSVVTAIGIVGCGKIKIQQYPSRE
jgi:hypothetical protein